MNTIEGDHSSDHDRLHALVEVWLNDAQLTRAKKWDLKEALQSESVVGAMAGMSDYGMLRNIPYSRKIWQGIKFGGLAV